VGKAFHDVARASPQCRQDEWAPACAIGMTVSACAIDKVHSCQSISITNTLFSIDAQANTTLLP
jgi:hypothetical protein